MLPIHAIVQFVDDTDPNTAMGYGTWTLVLPNADNGCVLITENPENGPLAGEQGWLVARENTTDPNHFSRSDATSGGTTTSGQVVPWLCVKTWKRIA